ncbi:dihydrodipicolinate synthase family protein [Bacillus taeanensis]|uniref:Dihydrodipicolinate synthase family protein n=1 Tax=Bacillus taeanensis TaxID=273032 RepID=A0A366Y427_9BACI|nr:dihydrodipicolinate synthase family protein [Bacillus taeanensis]RBW70941.1 dihydrodipicolinate synthase family protein [Bacillus taeanensis]
MKKLFKGIIPPVSTIFNENGRFDERGMAKMIDFLIESGVHGLFFLGSGGEFTQLSAAERKRIAAFSVQYVNGRVPVLIGTGSTNTREVIELNEHSEKIGADGVVIVNPYYWPLSEANLFKHYEDAANSINLPILLYNFPQLTGQDLSADFVLKLAAKHSNIVGIKETVDTASYYREMILKVKAEYPHFSIFTGYDDHLLNNLSLGGDGAISASSNFMPELTIGIYEAFQQKDFDKALKMHQQLAFLPLLYKLDAPFTNVIKEAVKLRGIPISTFVLPPGRALSEEKMIELKKLLDQASFSKITQ